MPLCLPAVTVAVATAIPAAAVAVIAVVPAVALAVVAGDPVVVGGALAGALRCRLNRLVHAGDEGRRLLERRRRGTDLSRRRRRAGRGRGRRGRRRGRCGGRLGRGRGRRGRGRCRRGGRGRRRRSGGRRRGRRRGRGRGRRRRRRRDGCDGDGLRIGGDLVPRAPCRRPTGDKRLRLRVLRRHVGGRDPGGGDRLDDGHRRRVGDSRGGLRRCPRAPRRLACGRRAD